MAIKKLQFCFQLMALLVCQSNAEPRAPIYCSCDALLRQQFHCKFMIFKFAATASTLCHDVAQCSTFSMHEKAAKRKTFVRTSTLRLNGIYRTEHLYDKAMKLVPLTAYEAIQSHLNACIRIQTKTKNETNISWFSCLSSMLASMCALRCGNVHQNSTTNLLLNMLSVHSWHR